MKIACIGRGGVGKTSFIALLARYFKDAGPNLLIDADPDQSLAEMIGIDLPGEGIKTISEILFDVKTNKIAQELKSSILLEKIDYLFHQSGLYEDKYFDFMSLGVKWTEGCYCQANVILKDLIDKLEKNYNYVLIDSPAGLEHLNRRITSSIDIIFDIVDPSRKAFANVQRAYRLIQEVKIKFDKFYLVANYRFSDELLPDMEKETGLKYAGKFRKDKELEKFILEGRSLFDLSEDSPAFNSLKEIMTKIGQ